MCELVCEAMKVQDMIQRGKSRVNVSALALEDDGVQELAASFTLLRSCPLDPREPHSLPCCFPVHVWSLPAGHSNKVPPFGTGRSPSAWKGSSMLWRGLLGGLDCHGDFSIHLARSPCHKGLFSQGLES